MQAMSPKPPFLFGAAALTTVALTASCSGSDAQDVLGQGTATGTSDAGSSGGVDSGGSGRCASESEPNEDRDHADALSGTFCGSIESRSDVDVLTFEIKATTKTMTIRFDGRVALSIDVEGQPTVTLGGGGTQAVPFVRGKPYFVTIKAAESAPPQAWRVELIEE